MPTKGIYASRISINAEFVNLNGLIQSGYEDYEVTIGEATRTEIEQIKAKLRTGQISGELILLETASFGELKTYWDAVNERIFVQEFRVPAGSITITAKMMNTGNGEIKALGGYVNLKLTNQTEYDVLIQRLDVTQRGLGTIILNDKGKPVVTNGVAVEGSYRQTWYQVDADGSVDVRVTDFIPQVTAPQRDAVTTYDANGNPIVPVGVNPTASDTVEYSRKMVAVGGAIGAPQDFISGGYYKPQEGWRYGWSVSTKQMDRVTDTYATSAWLGIDALAADPGNLRSSEYDLLEQPALVPGSDYFFLNAGDATSAIDVDAAYSFLSTTVILDQEVKDGNKWTTSTWYGKKTYWREVITETRSQNVATHTIEADRQVKISFLGDRAASIEIESTGSGKVLIEGGILNTTGLTSIVSNTVIEATNDDAVVQGVTINLEADQGIGKEFFRAATEDEPAGTRVAPLKIDLVDAFPSGHVSATPAKPSLTAVSSNGNIFIAEKSGDLTINRVEAGGDVVLLAQSADAAIVRADTGPGLVKGGSITLTATANIGVAGTGNAVFDQAINLDFGETEDDRVNIKAGGNIVITEVAPQAGSDLTGNMRIQRIETPGSVWIKVAKGSLIDADHVVERDERAIADLQNGVWADLQLIGPAAEQKIADTLFGYENTKRMEYQAYWNLRERLRRDEP